MLFTPKKRRKARKSTIKLQFTEKEFQSQIIAAAQAMGWLHYFTYDSRRSPAGFPDLVLVRERVIYAELKTDIGRMTADQKLWRDCLLAAGQEWYLWRPKDWEQIMATLADEMG